MAGIQTQQDLRDDVARDAGSVTNITRLVNRAARYVVNDIDLRSTKRMAYLSPGLNEGQYDYQAPADIKEWGLIDVRRIEGRQERDKFNMVTTEYFDRHKTYNKNLVSIEDTDWLKKLRISAETREASDREVVVDDCEDLTPDSGTWAVSGNASNLTLDTDFYVHGDASLNFDMATSWTAASAVLSGFDAVDLSDFETGGSVFVIVYIPSATGLSSVNLKIGSSSTAYFRQSKTVTNENLSFYAGLNLLRFDFAGSTETGTVDMDNIDYVELGFVGAGTGPASNTDWRIDYVVARRGKPHQVLYYTKFPWQSSSGTFLEESTATTDILNAENLEYELMVLKTKQILAVDLKNFEDAQNYEKAYEIAKARYKLQYPSEALLVEQSYKNFNNDPSWSWND